MSAYYQRGPSALGLEDANSMWNAINWLQKQSEATPKTRLMLAGYSRGASTVLAVAAKLGAVGKSIDSMFLFDAVSRQVLLGSSDIVSSVKFCRHAVRTDDADLVGKYETYLVNRTFFGERIAVASPVATNKTRPWFGHVALQAPRGVDFAKHVFRGSHGALGGVGWSDVPEDIPAQAAVAAWMNAGLATRGVPVTLTSFAP